MKILLLNTTSVGVVRFRMPLIRAFLEKGHDVFVACADDAYARLIETTGCHCILTKISNRSLNPFASLSYKKAVKKAFNSIKPDVVFAFQLKPNTFGIDAVQKSEAIKVFAMVEGAGDPFSKKGIKWALIRKIVCWLYKKSFKKCNGVFFLNQEDKNEFVEKKLLLEEQAVVIPGIGVDLTRFGYKPLKNTNRFLMVARMQKEKGVLDFCETARAVKRAHPNASFVYLGAEGNLKYKDIEPYVLDGSITYGGVVEDVRPFLEECTMLLLPSVYREGAPMSIMEAEAIGRGIIAFDNVGSRDLLIDGFNGFLVKEKTVQSLVEKCVQVLNNPKTAIEMGKHSRAFAEEKLDCTKINLTIINNLCA